MAVCCWGGNNAARLTHLCKRFHPTAITSRLIQINSKMKFTATVVLGLATISGANGKPSAASTKSAKSKSLSYETKSSKSKSSKAQCIEDSSLSLSYSSKSGKASAKSGKGGKAHLSLSMSMSMEYSEGCGPCAFLGPVFGVDCGTDVGFCSTLIGSLDGAPVAKQCIANNCIPSCFFLEPACVKCDEGPLFGANCPADGVNCEITWTNDAAPTCVKSDCVFTQECSLCAEAPEALNCPTDQTYCELDGTECVACNDPPAGDNARRLMETTGHPTQLFQW